MKTRQIGTLLIAISAVGISSATTILWCSGGTAFDQGWIDLLQAEGYTVNRLAAASVMTQAKVDMVNTFDLVIVGRDTISGDYASTEEVTLWNSITSPMICQNGYL